MCGSCGCSDMDFTINGDARHLPRNTHTIVLEKNILEDNALFSARNQVRFKNAGVIALNLVSSPGSGKTTLLTRTINDLKTEISASVIEGDQQTQNDARRIRETGAQAVQINTGKGCHLDAQMIDKAADVIDLCNIDLLFIENVGNLVCPAAFDLGEAHKILILSVTEGEDKPLKYPDIFHASDVLILNKIDLLPYVDFNMQQCIEYARKINPSIKVLPLSAKTGEGLTAWYDWLNLSLIKLKSDCLTEESI